MAIALRSPPQGKRYLGDRSTGEVHLIDAKGYRCCTVAEMIAAGTAVVFNPDTLTRAQLEGFDRCPWCIGPDPVLLDDLT